MKTRPNGRVYRTAEEWREIIKRQQQSGLTVRDFCAREDIHEKSFYRSRGKRKVKCPAIQPRFVELKAAGTGGQAQVRVELQLPNGAILRIA